jgi:transmembrane protein TMEM174 (potassium channel)
MDSGRLEAFSDGVFAVAITLLALNLTVPGPGHGPLSRQLADHWPSFAAYGSPGSAQSLAVGCLGARSRLAGRGPVMPTRIPAATAAAPPACRLETVPVPTALTMASVVMGMTPLNKPARSTPSFSTALYQARNATAVTTTVR